MTKTLSNFSAGKRSASANRFHQSYSYIAYIASIASHFAIDMDIAL
jgi:hypothetical protein